MEKLSSEGRTITGTGIIFNSESQDLGGFVETIMPGAVDGIIESSDIVFLMNHSYEKGVLARSTKGKGSLSLTKTATGVQYEFTAPRTGAGPELLENIQRGEVNASSFSFTVDPSGETWRKTKTGYLRTITKLKEVFDFSAVYRAAYQATSCQVRSTDDTWRERYATSERSETPSQLSHKCTNVLNLLNLKEDAIVEGKELHLFIRMLEERGINVPSIAPEKLSRKEVRDFKKEYDARGEGLKPEIKQPYKMSEEDQALYDANQRLKRGN